MPFRPDNPYNDLPDLPPRLDVETRAVLKACIGARAALAELRSAGQLIPNQAVLINSIPLLEAQASSEIENIVTTTDRLFRFANDLASADLDQATKETLRYRTALRIGSDLLAERPVSTFMAVVVCRAIKGVEMDIRTVPGTVLRNDATGATIYTPPEGEDRIRDKLANWERYIHDAEDIDPLIRLAIMHYQFEAIHPFSDGNGRTGRILNLLYLVDKGLLDLPVLYLSRYIINTKAEYYRLIMDVTARNAWEDWILYVLAAVQDTAIWTTAKIRAIRQLLDLTILKVRELAPKIYSRELIELVFAQPYCRISDVVGAGLLQRQSASIHLKTLTEVGVLEQRQFGRERLFLNPALLRLLSDR